MARKGKSTEEIIQALREAEVRLGQGETVGKICRGFGISEQARVVLNSLTSHKQRLRIQACWLKPVFRNARRICFSISTSAKNTAPTATIKRPSKSGTALVPNTD